MSENKQHIPPNHDPSPPPQIPADKPSLDPQTDGMDAANNAIAQLAIRIAKLESHVPTITSSTGDPTDLRPILAATCASLKQLRTMIVTASSELDGRLKEMESVKGENDKLKYQIMHLKRSLEAAEAENKS